MNIRDKVVLRNWLAGGATLDSVLNAPRFGLVENERFTETARRAYVGLWTWSAPRFSGSANTLQDKFIRRYGYQAFERRVAKVRQAIAVLTR